MPRRIGNGKTKAFDVSPSLVATQNFSSYLVAYIRASLPSHGARTRCEVLDIL